MLSYTPRGYTTLHLHPGAERMTEKTISLANMSCGHCVRAVEGALKELAGIERADVSVGRATVRFDPTRTSEQAIAEALTEAGYPPLAQLTR